MEKSSKEGLIVDTSAFVSLESIELLEDAIKLFDIITTYSVIDELEEFSKHEDKYGKIAKRVLKFKDIFIIKSAKIKERIRFLEETDNELYNLAINERIPLVTDDHKLNHHTKDKITVYFSTFFLVTLVTVGIITKGEALNKLETLRDIRNWQNNIIYLTTKRELRENFINSRKICEANFWGAQKSLCDF